jgi:hypothetical protein
MANLRKEVRRLEEDELFEQTILRGSEIEQQEQQPSSGDIDAIMKSIMDPPVSQGELPADLAGFADTLKGHGMVADESVPNDSQSTAGKPIGKGKAKQK